MIHEAIDNDSSEAFGVEPTWTVDGLKSAEWAMRKIADAQQKIDSFDAQANEWLEEIEAWHQRVIKRPTQTIEFFSEHLRRYALAQRALDPNAKTLVLPSGEVRTRAVNDRVVVRDKELVLAWARTAAPEVIQITETIKADELTKHITKVDKDGTTALIDATTGEFVEGLGLELARVTAKVVPLDKTDKND